MLFAILGCGPVAVSPPALTELETELVSEQASDSVLALDDLALLLSSEQGILQQHPLSGQPAWLWDRPSSLDAAVQVPGLGLVVATPDGLLAGDGLLGDSPLQEQLQDVHGLLAAGDGLVLIGEQIWAWRAGTLHALDGVTGPVATLPDGTIYATDGPHRVTLVRSGSGWAQSERTRAPAQALAVDGAGTLWRMNGRVLESSLGPSWELPETLVSLHACAESTGAWVRDELGDAWWFDAELQLRAQVPESATLDGQCRWLVATERGLERLSWGRPIGLWGLDELLLGDTRLAVLPTLPEQVTELRIYVDDQAMEHSLGVLVLDPSPWPQGAVLRVEVDYQDGWTSALERAFSVGDPGQVSWDQVEEIYLAHCALCHAGGTETELVGAQAWQDNIELILTSVSSGTMPLGKTPLTGAQIATLRAWRDGGFQ